MIRTKTLSLVISVLLCCFAAVHSLSAPNKNKFNRREYLQRTLALTPLIVPSISNAIIGADEQGVSAVTDSQLGRAFRKSIVQGAQVADKLDEKWEKLSDSLRVSYFYILHCNLL